MLLENVYQGSLKMCMKAKMLLKNVYEGVNSSQSKFPKFPETANSFAFSANK